MRLVPDNTGRFAERPFFEDGELDAECERIVAEYLRAKYGEVKFPISTDDLACIVERKASLDLYVQLNDGEDGKTDFRPKKPDVSISEHLSSEANLENRLRTTLAHEYGHVHFHGPFYEMKKAQPSLELFSEPLEMILVSYRNDNPCANKTDWLEWQAGYVSGAILMPISNLKPRVIHFFEQRGISNAIQADEVVARELIRRVMERYQVSADAARVRLQQLGFISNNNTLLEQSRLF